MDAVVVSRLHRLPVREALVVIALAAATIAAAFAFQAAGFAPCELCLKERLPYYVAIALAAVTVAAAWSGSRPTTVAGFAALVLICLFSAGFGAYHSGVEWGFWPGPTDCTGSLTRATTNADFLAQLRTVKVVRCDAVAIRILGLSLAGWNVLVSLALGIVSGIGLRGSLHMMRAG